MATATFNVAIDMRTFAGYDFSTIFGSGGHGTTTTTENDWYFNSGYYEFITGSGFDTSGVFPTQGTVTGWELGVAEVSVNPADPWNPVTQNVDFWKFTGLSVPASDFSTAIEGTGADVAAYMPTMLAHADTINGSAYDDYLLGYAGNDTINGNAGADGLEGGNGNDILNGGVGNDTMIGGVGDDTYIVDSSGDKVIEDASAGTDVIKSSVSMVIPANVENLNLTGTGAINGTGNALANVINGNGAANKLSGAAGNDVLRGAGGNDTLIGGSGNDTLDGGANADQFLFNTTPNATTNHDNILAYSVADDTIALDQTIFTGLPTLGTLDASAFYAGTSAHDADDRIIYNSATGNIYYDADGNGSGAQVLFAHVTAGTGLTNADFLIVA